MLRVWHVTAHVTGTLTPRPVWEELKSDTRNRNQAAPLTWLFTCFSLIASYLTKRNLLNEIGFHGGVQGHGLVARNQIVFRTGELPSIHGPLLASERRLYCILQARGGGNRPGGKRPGAGAPSAGRRATSHKAGNNWVERLIRGISVRKGFSYQNMTN